jgi:small subunit ribosomal protein S17
MEKKRKTRIGYVVSNKMDKTITVMVESPKQHSLYKKTIRHKAKFKAHDGNNDCQEGDLVRIVETQPLSKTKRWRVVEIISRKGVAEVQPSEVG